MFVASLTAIDPTGARRVSHVLGHVHGRLAERLCDRVGRPLTSSERARCPTSLSDGITACEGGAGPGPAGRPRRTAQSSTGSSSGR
ncbi:hypothetical protein GCM10010279_14680 [Streptomyces mutabilis]|nr:hypothetical protein GCM10010279_14680 [Streptomyces mutabilis]